MKKILTLARLLLTLPMVMRVEAQTWTNESMHECEEDGFKYMTDLPCEGPVICESRCPSCESFFGCDEIEDHKKTCNYICPWCDLKMDVKDEPTHECQNDPDPNDPDCNKNCVFCGMPLDQCICPGPVIKGKEPHSVPGGGGGPPPNS